MMKLNAWIENHRTGIAGVVNAVSFGTWLASMFFVRTLAGAGLILLYSFFNATPETTVYQLSQIAHAENFWLTSFMLAAVYSAMYAAIHGVISGHRPAVLGEAISARASSAAFDADVKLGR